MATAVASPLATASESSPKTSPTNEEDKPADRIPTPPTSEDMNKQDDQSSELSELEDNDIELDDVKPDHYWDEENGGRIPVFKPVCISWGS